MKKSMSIIGIIILLLLICIIYWTYEPFSLNPFADKPISISQNSNYLNCEKLSGFSNKADSIIDSLIEANSFLGVSTGVYSEKCGKWLSTAGFINKSTQEKPNQFTRFRLASVSKPMTAVAILQLYEKDILDLDLPIQTYIPEFPKKEKGDITIRQLLNHTSGLPYFKSNFESVHFTHYNSQVKALDRFKEKNLEHKPGETYLYSSYGYTLLGAIIEKVTGKSYHEYMKENIWLPTKMTNTDIEDVNVDYKNKSNYYIKYGSNFYRFPQNDLSYSYSGGGLQSTADDLLKFGKAILNYELINPKTTELILQLSDSSDKEKEYTLGWYNWITPKYGQVIEHHGKQVGCSSFFRIFFDQRKVVVTLANNMNSREEVRSLSIELSYLMLKMEYE